MGIESSAMKLHNQLLLHPDRYFFILVIEERAVLCLQTCDCHGNDIEIKEIDGLILDCAGNLVSIFKRNFKR
jgi:hypothetical protein